jgi:hypothetical protein
MTKITLNMELHKKHKSIKALFGLCASSVADTYHHWRVFTVGSEGACIQFDRRALERSLKSRTDVRW